MVNEYDAWFAEVDARIDADASSIEPLSVDDVIPLPDREVARIRGALVSSVEPEEVEWLWYPYIPIGKLTLLEGDPGVGKSWLTAAITAAISSGRPLPGHGPAKWRRVMLFSAEDGIGDTIRPRLDTMSAANGNVWAASEAIAFDAAGLRRLELEISEQKPRLVVVDPLVAYLGGKVDFHRANEVRAMLAPLAEIAQNHHCAVLAVRHLSKSQSKGLYRGQGSIDITAAARSVLLAGVLPTDPDVRGLVQIKSNLAPMGDPIGYRLDGEGFAWVDDPGIDADDILGTAADRSQLEAAMAWLIDLLKHGPLPATEVQEAGRQAGHSPTTIGRAKKQARVKAQKRQGVTHGEWYWLLPGQKLEPEREITNLLDL